MFLKVATGAAYRESHLYESLDDESDHDEQRDDDERPSSSRRRVTKLRRRSRSQSADDNTVDLLVMGMHQNTTVVLLVLDSGLPYTTTTEQLRTAFEQYGEVAMAEVKCDIETSRPRGFGFVRFAKIASQKAVLAMPAVYVGGRECTVKIPYDKVM